MALGSRLLQEETNTNKHILLKFYTFSLPYLVKIHFTVSFNRKKPLIPAHVWFEANGINGPF